MQLPDNEWIVSKFVSVKIESSNFIFYSQCVHFKLQLHDNKQ